MKLVVIMILLCLSIVGVGAAFYEDWGGDPIQRWSSVTGGYECSIFSPGLLSMDCQSAALISDASVNGYVNMSGSNLVTRGQNSTTDANLSHFTLYHSDDGQGANYVGIYLSHDLVNNVDKVFVLGFGTSAYIKSVSHGWHNLQLSYNQECSGRWFWKRCNNGVNVYIDGAKIYRKQGTLLNPIHAWLGCSSVNPGQPNDGSYSHCESGSVTLQ